MAKLNCPNCKRTRRFILTENNQYKCQSCEETFKQCKIKDCKNLVKIGFICEKCVGKGIKNGGAVAGAGLIAIAGTAYKILKGKK